MPVDQTSLLGESAQVAREETAPEKTTAVAEPVAPIKQTQDLSKSSADPAAPMCYNCGNQTQRAGSCYVCTSCGSTTGCS